MDCSWITSALYYIIHLIYTVSALMGKSTIIFRCSFYQRRSRTMWIYIMVDLHILSSRKEKKVGGRMGMELNCFVPLWFTKFFPDSFRPRSRDFRRITFFFFFFHGKNYLHWKGKELISFLSERIFYIVVTVKKKKKNQSILLFPCFYIRRNFNENIFVPRFG